MVCSDFLTLRDEKGYDVGAYPEEYCLAWIQRGEEHAMCWQNEALPAEDTAQTWEARRRDLAWIEVAVAARRMWAAAEEA